jgi:hypothetical protein
MSPEVTVAEVNLVVFLSVIDISTPFSFQSHWIVCKVNDPDPIHSAISVSERGNCPRGRSRLRFYIERYLPAPQVAVKIVAGGCCKEIVSGDADWLTLHICCRL